MVLDWWSKLIRKLLSVQGETPLGLLIYQPQYSHGGFQGLYHTTRKADEDYCLFTLICLPPCVGNTEYYHGSRSILRITKSVAILGYLTSQSWGASADQSRNAVIFPRNINNIIKSCLNTPEYVNSVGLHSFSAWPYIASGAIPTVVTL